MFKSVAARKLAWVVVVGGDGVVVVDDDAVFVVAADAQIIKFTRINATSFMFFVLYL